MCSPAELHGPLLPHACMDTVTLRHTLVACQGSSVAPFLATPQAAAMVEVSRGRHARPTATHMEMVCLQPNQVITRNVVLLRADIEANIWLFLDTGSARVLDVPKEFFKFCFPSQLPKKPYQVMVRCCYYLYPPKQRIFLGPFEVVGKVCWCLEFYRWCRTQEFLDMCKSQNIEPLEHNLFMKRFADWMMGYDKVKATTASASSSSPNLKRPWGSVGPTTSIGTWGSKALRTDIEVIVIDDD